MLRASAAASPVCCCFSASAWRLRSSRKPTADRSGQGEARRIAESRRPFHHERGMDGHHRVMREIELKFQVPPERRSAVDAAVAGRSPAPRTRLQAAYYDTVD